MSQYLIVVLVGDGIGLEVMQEVNKVLDVVEKKFNIILNCMVFFVGGYVIDIEGEVFLLKILLGCEQVDVILFGSIGGFKWDILFFE